MDLNDRLKQCRESSGLSQTEAAEQLGFTRQALSRWENGQTEPNTETLAKMAKLYGKTMSELLNEEPKKMPEEMPEAAAETLPAAQKKLRVLLIVLATLLTIAVSFAAGWYAHVHVQSHTVNEMQLDLNEPHGTLEIFPVEDD